MVDWIQGDFPNPLGRIFYGGRVLKVKPCGEIEWTTNTAETFEGSHGSGFFAKSLDSQHEDSLKIDRSLRLYGNPAKFLQGHNLFGTDNLEHAATECMARMCNAVGAQLPANIDLGSARLTRVDLTGSWLVPSSGDVVPFIRSIAERGRIAYGKPGFYDADNPGTCYFGRAKRGGRAKRWMIKIYAKWLELQAHPLPIDPDTVPGLVEEVSRTVRVELTLRSGELKRLGLSTVKDWRAINPADVWDRYVSRLQIGEFDVTRLDPEVLNLPPRLAYVVSAWQKGDDIRDNPNMSRATKYRWRNTIKRQTGVDIFTPVPKSNVIPLRRVIEAIPARTPQWGNDLSEAMRKVAI